MVAPVREHSRRILLVDDNEVVLRTLQRAFVRRGFDIVAALSGTTALHLLPGGRFDTVVSDYMLGPGIDGLAVLEAAARLYPESTRILLTGSADTEVYAAQERGRTITYLLHKPVEFARLYRCIASSGAHAESAPARSPSSASERLER
ncbi:MAG: response regulator [Deltaproteobacteria bacterium]|nr:MAG: response regulator [Deltaproteobacteria bacterium]